MAPSSAPRRQRSSGEIDPRTLAYGIIQSGELGPMFFNALGTTKQDVLGALGAG